MTEETTPPTQPTISAKDLDKIFQGFMLDALNQFMNNAPPEHQQLTAEGFISLISGSLNFTLNFAENILDQKIAKGITFKYSSPNYEISLKPVGKIDLKTSINTAVNNSGKKLH